jgi:DNA-binding NarL/FixJ family response regulator
MRAPGSSHIIIADDHTLFRKGIRQLLEGEGRTVACEARSGAEAISCVRLHAGSITLLDIGLPDIDGIEVMRRLKDEGLDAKVIILSAREDQDALLGALAAGAMAYLAKEAASEQLLPTIEVVERGGAVLSSTMVQSLATGIRGMDYLPGEYQRRDLDLTARELEVLRQLATPLSVEQIAFHLFVSKKTVQNNISTLCAKLGARGRDEAVARGVELDLIAS